ncbi:MAG: adenylate/guanylate cyclase domain-containing protein [Polyangiaceae bacterium]
MSDEAKLRAAIQALEAQRLSLGNTVVDTATAGLREKLAQLGSLSGDTRQLVSVLFADVSGFTKLSERLDPEEVQALLKKVWAELDAVILSRRGHIDKHIGDAVMAVWGLSGARARDAEDAVRAGLELQRQLGALCRREGLELAMRVGINSGPTSVSRVASTGEWNVIGDTVNVASRLEHAAALGAVLIGNDTAAQVADAFELEPQPPLTVKGKQEPLTTFVVKAPRAASVRLPSHTLTGVGAPFVGRAAELGELLTLYQRARAGETLATCICAEGGVGKSRLLAEATRLIRLQADPILLVEHACEAEGEQRPFGLLAGLIRNLAGRGGDEPVRGFARLLERYLGADVAGEAQEFIAYVLGFGAATSALQRLERDPRQIRGRAEVLLLRLFEALCAERTLVLLVEELQRADGMSLTFLARLRERAKGLLLLATARPDLWQRPDADLSWWRRFDLAPLGRSDTHQLAQSLLGAAAELPGWVADFLVERSGGNPFFCEELLRALLERGVVRVDEQGAWRASERPASFSLPPRLAPLVLERLGHVSTAARVLLERVAIVGPRAERARVVALLDGPPDDSALDELRQANLLRFADGPADAELGFVHSLTWEVTYEYTLLETRRSLHGRLADRLAQDANAPPQEVAHHYRAARRSGEAAEFYARAGERARRADSVALATRFFGLALELNGGSRGIELRAHEGLGELEMRSARYENAVASYRAMLGAAAAEASPLAQARAHNGLSWALAQASKPTEAALAAEQAAEIAGSTFDTARDDARRQAAALELANAWHNLSWAAVLVADADQALAAAEEGLAVAEQAGAEREQALCLNLIGVVHYHLLDRYAEGARYLEQALERYRAMPDRWGIACQLNNLGDLARLRGDPAAAVGLLEEALEMTRAIGHTSQELVVLTTLGATHNALGQCEQAVRVLRQALSLATVGEPFTRGSCLASLCDALAVLGQGEEAARAGCEALQIAGQDTTVFRGEALRALGRALASTGQPVECAGRQWDAEACFAGSVAVFHELGQTEQRAESCRRWAEFERARGERARADELIAEASRARDSE